MNKVVTLSHGRAFEMEIFGVTEGSFGDLGAFIRHKYMDFDSSIQQIIEYNWAMYADALESGEGLVYNPLNPHVGKSHLLWESVKNGLGSKVGVRGNLPLNLYIAIGRNALDYHHGVDAFFWWQGVYATIDVSVRIKDSRELKADFLFLPKDLERSRLLNFGKNVASLLIEREMGVEACGV